MVEITKEHLVAALAEPLPGISAQIKMAPPGRDINASNENARRSAVLILFMPFDNELSICLIKRSSLLKHHPGQISFPGGSEEKFDNSPIETALRETNEEIGVAPEYIEVLGLLSRLYVPVSNFEIQAVVGWSNKTPKFTIDRNEVDEVFVVPFSNFMEYESIRIEKIKVQNFEIEVPCFKIDQKVIWGATAMIISELITMLKHVD